MGILSTLREIKHEFSGSKERSIRGIRYRAAFYPYLVMDEGGRTTPGLKMLQAGDDSDDYSSALKLQV